MGKGFGLRMRTFYANFIPSFGILVDTLAGRGYTGNGYRWTYAVHRWLEEERTP